MFPSRRVSRRRKAQRYGKPTTPSALPFPSILWADETTEFIKGNKTPAIRVKENEPFEVAMRRFKRAVEKTGLLTELRAREAYEKPTTERKRKKAAAVKRLQKRLRSQQLPPKMY